MFGSVEWFLWTGCVCTILGCLTLSYTSHRNYIKRQQVQQNTTRLTPRSWKSAPHFGFHVPFPHWETRVLMGSAATISFPKSACGNHDIWMTRLIYDDLSDSLRFLIHQHHSVHKGQVVRTAAFCTLGSTRIENLPGRLDRTIHDPRSLWTRQRSW